MDYTVTNNARDFTLSPAQQDLVTEHAGQLDPLLASFAGDEVHLRVIVDDEAGRGNAIEVKLRLALPQRLLNAHEAGAFEPAVNKAFKDLRRQVLEHKDHLGRDHRANRGEGASRGAGGGRGSRLTRRDVARGLVEDGATATWRPTASARSSPTATPATWRALPSTPSRGYSTCKHGGRGRIVLVGACPSARSRRRRPDHRLPLHQDHQGRIPADGPAVSLPRSFDAVVDLGPARATTQRHTPSGGRLNGWRSDTRARLTPYIHFNGECRAAMTFYRDCLSGALEIQTVGESPMAAAMPAETHDRVLHAVLVADGITVMASGMGGSGHAGQGGAIALCVNSDDLAQTRSFFDNLSVGANVTNPLKEEYFGTYGDLTDRYGISWMFQVDNGRNA